MRYLNSRPSIIPTSSFLIPPSCFAPDRSPAKFAHALVNTQNAPVPVHLRELSKSMTAIPINLIVVSPIAGF